MVKLTLQGKYNYATVFTENIEDTAIGQVIGMLNEPITKNTTVAIMPDVHTGKGSTIGTTIKLPEDKKDWKVCPNITGVDLGCLDKDTEILTPNGWLTINQYKNQKILVYNPETDQTTFETPKAYIKLPCNKFFHYINGKGMNQMVSEEHTMLVYSGYKSRGFKPMTLYPHELNQKSFANNYYTTKTTFQTNTQGVNLTDTELRLRVMIQADGSMREQKDNHELLFQMYDEPFYVWRYGPVVPKIYRKFRIYGASSIIEKGEKNIEYSIFNDSIIKLLKEDLFTLIDKSREHKFWQENKDKIVNGTSDVKYTLDDVLND